MTAPRPIGINLLWLVPGDVGGTEEYTVRLLRALGQATGSGGAFVTPRVVEAYPWLDTIGELAMAPDPGTSRLRRVGIEGTWLAHQAMSCLFVHHFGGTIPAGNRTPAVTTIHDLQPLDQPDTFGRAKAWWLGRRLPIAVAESTRVLTPSQWVADSILARFDIDSARVRVIPSSHSNPAPQGGALQASPTAPERLGIGTRYILYPTITYPFKNHRVLVEAIARADADVDLVFTGGAGAAHGDVLDAIDRLGVSTRVHVLGRLGAGDFDELFAGALALAFPSTYEGFGLPVIEAMARRIPVLASDLPVLREVAGAGACFVDPHDAGAWASAIERVANGRSADGRSVEEMVTAGERRAADFDPTVSAGRLIAVYRELLASQ